jgi:hypothetical protein
MVFSLLEARLSFVISSHYIPKAYNGEMQRLLHRYGLKLKIVWLF